ncbi:hypothetical protein HPB48_000316 [Haemaphysalis longicornis]|uniref:Peptidase M13 C-terminal domain-containing protein n=1 Tax=Haemaphysalis longicornis TaxID=44386 RepID=A0A9J6G0M4_HAELO|nr:hypothetical protein HPB48_000316 [Haemaphysalis longicornis]
MEAEIRSRVSTMVSAARVPPTGQSAFEKAVATYRACVSLYAHNRSEAVQLRQFLTMLRLDTVRPDPSQNPLESIVQLNLAWGLGAIIEIQEAAGTRLEFPHQFAISKGSDDSEEISHEVHVEDVPKYLNGVVTNVVTVDALRDTAYMGRRIRESVKATVGNSGWLPRTAQNAARRKVKSMRLFIGFPLNLTRLALLEEFYEDLPDVTLASTAAESDGETVGGELSNGGSSFVLSWLNASRFQRRAQIRHPREIMFTLAAANAQNTYTTNTVNIAAALVRPVVYFLGAVAGYNYGGIGSVIGHEMMHAFDVRGRGYDETGAESKWWPKQATGKYTAQALCLRSSHEEALQKRRAVVLDPTLDSENLADVMGVRVAFDAFRNLTAMVSGREGGSIEDASSVSVAGFNERQLFFIAHCAKQCDPKPPPRMRDPRVPYAPNWSRCVVPLMQMPEFSEAFNCARGTLMNPDKKCRFW